MQAAQTRQLEASGGFGKEMNLQEQYADALNNLLWTLKTLKSSGEMVDGVPVSMLFESAKSEINGLAQGFREKDECKNCSDCCVKPPAIVPAQGMDGGVVRPLRYTIKHKRQPCWWLRDSKDGFRCSLHDTGEKPYTCYSYQCISREDLEEKISNSEKKQEV